MLHRAGGECRVQFGYWVIHAWIRRSETRLPAGNCRLCRRREFSPGRKYSCFAGAAACGFATGAGDLVMVFMDFLVPANALAKCVPARKKLPFFFAGGLCRVSHSGGDRSGGGGQDVIWKAALVLHRSHLLRKKVKNISTVRPGALFFSPNGARRQRKKLIALSGGRHPFRSFRR